MPEIDDCFFDDAQLPQNELKERI